MEAKILALLKENMPDIDFESSVKLVDDEILDSVSMVEAISLLSEEFDISIPYYEITAENFNSVAAMARLVTKLQG